MSLLDRILRRPPRRDERAVSRSILLGPGAPVWSGQGYESYAREGLRRNPYVHRAIRLIAGAVSGIPWELYQHDPASGDREVVNADHQLIRVLRRPSPHMSGPDLIDAIVTQYLLAGEAFVLRLPREGTYPVELWLLRPDLVTIHVDKSGLPVRYEYRIGDRPQAYPADQVLHLRMWHPTEPLRGLSPMEAAARSVDLNNAARGWNAALLQNGAVPAGALVSSATLTEEQRERIRTEFHRRHGGPGKAGRVLVLEGDLSYQRIGLDANDVSWGDGLRLSAREIALVFGVPPELLGDAENKTYSNYREARQAFYTETVLPLLDRLTAAFTAWLADKHGLYYSYDRDQIEALAEDRQQVWERVNAAVTNGILTPNEAREALGYSPFSGADFLRVPASAIPLDGGVVDVQDAGAKGIEDALGRAEAWKRFDRRRSGYEDALAQYAQKQLEHEADAIAERVANGSDWETYLEQQHDAWARILTASHMAVAEEYAQVQLDELLGEKGLERRLDLRNMVAQRVAAWLEREGGRHIRGIIETTRRAVAAQLARGVEEGEGIPELADRVRRTMRTASPARARRIARTEVVGASNHGAHIGAEASGLPLKKIWLATADARTRDDHANADGQEAPMDGTFVVGGYPMRYPGDGSLGAPASEIVNCRCAVAFRPRS